MIGFDFETFPIGPGAVTPKAVCLSYAIEGNAFLASDGDGSDIEDACETFLDSDQVMIAHNAAYDMAVMAVSFPRLVSKIWAKYERGEVICTKICEQLLNLATHGRLDMIELPDGSTSKIQYTLAALEKKYLHIDRSDQKGDDSWRVNYHLLSGRPSGAYPPDARQYALDDSIGAVQVYMRQLEEAPAGALETAEFNAMADFALFRITDRGMAIDKDRVAVVRAELQEELSPEKLQPLVDAGILRKGEGPRPHTRSLKKAQALIEEHYPDVAAAQGVDDWDFYRQFLEEQGIKFTKGVAPSVDTKVLKDRIVEVSGVHGMQVKLTDTGAVSTDSEVISDLAGLDPVIECYKARQVLQKLVTTEIPRMEWEGELADTVHFPFRVLLETGRTSSYANRLFPSGNGQQLHPKIRPCYVARPGHVLLSVDYSALELAAVGQRMINLFGESVHADMINSNVDLHAFLAGRLTYELNPDFAAVCDEEGLSTNMDLYEAFMQTKGREEIQTADGDEFYGWWRTFSKPVGLGYPGGLGPVTFLDFAKKSYGVNVSEIAAKFDDDRFEITPRLLGICKRLGLIKEASEFIWTPRTKAIALADQLRDLWLDLFQMRPYYQHVQKNMLDPEFADQEGRARYCYTSDLGMTRRNCSYTAACNGYAMQTESAYGAKLAVIEVVRACQDPFRRSILYGDFVVDFVHDELMLELKEENLHAKAEEVGRLMREAMWNFMPDITGLSTEAVLMRRWDKKAKPTFKNGELVVTELAA